MLLLSLGPDLLIALLKSGRPDAEEPDLSWLLFGPVADDAENSSHLKAVDG